MRVWVDHVSHAIIHAEMFFCHEFEIFENEKYLMIQYTVYDFFN